MMGRAWPRRWGYAAASDATGRRDLRLDLLRGFAVFAMVVDHIGGESSWLYAITGGDRFFVSAAELFVVLSGLTMGMVYSGLFARGGTRAVLIKAVRRAYLLYVLTVSLTLVTSAVALALRLPWAPPLSAGAATDFVWGVLTLQRAYALTDMLLLYTFLILIAGPVLALVARGGTWLVLAASWSVWLLWQLSPRHAQLAWPIAEDTAFPFAAWQIYFFTALSIGFHRRSLASWLRPVPAGVALAVSGTLAAGLLALYLAVPASPTTAAEGPFAHLVADLFYKYDVRAGRLVAALVCGSAAYCLITLAWAPLRRGLGWLLLPLGQHALTAYALHLFVVPLVAVAVPALWSAGATSAAENTLIQMAGVLVIWIVVVARSRAAGAASAMDGLLPRPARAGSPPLLGWPAALGAGRRALGIVVVAASLVVTLSGPHLWPNATTGTHDTAAFDAEIEVVLLGDALDPTAVETVPTTV